VTDDTVKTAAEQALEMAATLAKVPRDELPAFAAKLRRKAAGAGELIASERATAALVATAIDNFLESGADMLPELLRMCQVVERSQRDAAFDWQRELFQLDRVSIIR
jgi:hypothetical protein